MSLVGFSWRVRWAPPHNQQEKKEENSIQIQFNAAFRLWRIEWIEFELILMEERVKWAERHGRSLSSLLLFRYLFISSINFIN